MPQQKFNQVFISYRRETSHWVAGRIYDYLVGKFGKETIFKDINSSKDIHCSIPLGSEVKQHIEKVMEQCRVLLTIIDKNWVGEDSDTGRRRIDEPDDFVRFEVESALKYDVRIMPLLVQGAEMPSAKDLPPQLATLPSLQRMDVNPDPHFYVDMEYLIFQLEPILRLSNRDREILKWLAIGQAIFIVLLVIAISVNMYFTPIKLRDFIGPENVDINQSK